MKTLKDLLKDTPVTALHGDGSTTVAALAYDSRAVTRATVFSPPAARSPTGTTSSPTPSQRRLGRRLRAVACRNGPRGGLRRRPRRRRSAGRHGRSLLRPPEPRTKTRGHHRHQRQDHDRNIALRPGAGTGLQGRAGLDGRLQSRRTHRRGDPHHARPRAAERHDARDGRRRVRILLHGVFVACHRAATHAGLHFAGGIFSNITHDHLDYHKTFAEYIRAKNSSSTPSPRMPSP